MSGAPISSAFSREEKLFQNFTVPCCIEISGFIDNLLSGLFALHSFLFFVCFAALDFFL